MTPAPLPPEEIETLAEHTKLWPSVYLSSEKLSAMLAEIEAGRAGAERVPEVILNRLSVAANHSPTHVDRLGIGYVTVRHDDLGTAVAALRQAAQPAGRVEEAAFRAGHRLGSTGYPWITVDEGWQRHRDDALYATQPASGAVDDGENGR